MNLSCASRSWRSLQAGVLRFWWFEESHICISTCPDVWTSDFFSVIQVFSECPGNSAQLRVLLVFYASTIVSALGAAEKITDTMVSLLLPYIQKVGEALFPSCVMKCIVFCRRASAGIRERHPVWYVLYHSAWFETSGRWGSMGNHVSSHLRWALKELSSTLHEEWSCEKWIHSLKNVFAMRFIMLNHEEMESG